MPICSRWPRWPCSAFDRFDINRGVKFPVFGMPAIVGEVKNYFRDRTRLIRVSRRDVELIKAMEDASRSWCRRLQYVPRAQDLAEFLNVSVETVLELMETQRAYSVSSTRFQTGTDESADLLEVPLAGRSAVLRGQVELRLL